MTIVNRFFTVFGRQKMGCFDANHTHFQNGVTYLPDNRKCLYLGGAQNTMKKDISELFTNFRLRKRLLALADGFIVVIAGLLANFPIPIYASRIGRPELFSFMSTCVVCCLAALLLVGAYNKLWRYFSQKDYVSCIIGVVLGYSVAIGLYYIITGVSYLRFSALSCLLTIVGICLFRIVWIATVFAHFGTLLSLCLSYVVSWTITSIALLIYYKKGTWMRRKGIAER